MQGAEAIRPDQRSWHPLTTLTNVAGEGCQAMPTHRTQPSRPGRMRQQKLTRRESQVSGSIIISRVAGSMRISARSAEHSFDPMQAP